MTSLIRRKLVFGAVGLSAAGLGGWYLYRGGAPGAAQDMLACVVDTIVPRDEHAGALDLHLDKELKTRLEQDPKKLAQFAELLELINQAAVHRHRREFVRLNQDDREDVLISMLEAENSAPGYVQMHRLRATILTWYYRSAEAHSAIGYTAPNRYPAYPGAPKAG